MYVRTEEHQAHLRNIVPKAVAANRALNFKNLRVDAMEVRKEKAIGFFFNSGYKFLTGIENHPLAYKGTIGEHRKVLYEKIGPGPHRCHWEWCGHRELNWLWDYPNRLEADHLDHDRTNNSPENLVPCCRSCNAKRASLRRWAQKRAQ